LADAGTEIGSEIEHFLLGDLPNGLIDGLDVVRDPQDIVNRAVVHNNHILDLVRRVREEARGRQLGTLSEDTARVDVAVGTLMLT